MFSVRRHHSAYKTNCKRRSVSDCHCNKASQNGKHKPECHASDKGLCKLCEKLPEAIEKIAPVLIYPVVGILAMGIKPARMGSINPNATPPIFLNIAATGVIVPKFALSAADMPILIWLLRELKKRQRHRIVS